MNRRCHFSHALLVHMMAVTVNVALAREGPEPGHVSTDGVQQGPRDVYRGDVNRAAEMTALKATVQALQSTVQDSATTGSTVVRWGRTLCLSGSTVVYFGYAAGGYSSHSGTGANRICLTSHPVHDNQPLSSGGHGRVYGAQYYLSQHALYTDVLCSLCLTPLSATFMVPGTNSCPYGTTEQYHGYLSSGNSGSPAPSEFLCLDSNPEDRPASGANQASAWFDHVEAVCGSLPCPPYVAGHAATCVVCSK